MTRLRRGAYAPRDEFADASATARHRALAEAVSNSARDDVVFSHRTAAVLLGIPLLGEISDAVHVRSGAAVGRRSRNGIVRHAGEFADEVFAIDRFWVTSPALTVLDLAASDGVLAGMIAAEHVLRPDNRLDVSHDALSALHHERRPYANCRQVDRVLALASSASASPLETLSRFRFHEYGFVQPEQQREYRGLDGHRYAVDF
ncbi:hypothetical protein [Diaminobutyricimonas aerilata]|uniref:hypothetical protein n=1 Tax=Diaminobutyricimonas aerilata TaxID=1162967 RepID=UPI000C240FF6|nr:hypothetical protein [Diaminobutyricimonas aerilata]